MMHSHDQGCFSKIEHLNPFFLPGKKAKYLENSFYLTII